jgi:hypothetical protein
MWGRSGTASDERLVRRERRLERRKRHAIDVALKQCAPYLLTVSMARNLMPVIASSSTALQKHAAG